MLTCCGTFVPLWLLICLCKCNGTRPMHQLSSEENDNFKTPTSSPKSSQLLSPGNDTSECAMPWSCCDHEVCQCQDILPNELLKCGKNKTLSVVVGNCVTIDERTDILEVGHCLYNYDDSLISYTDIPKNKSMLNGFMCKESESHRTGTLCGECQDGYYPLAYSFDMKCIQCPNGRSNWWKFVLAAFLPLTIFYIIILFFKINVVSSHFQGFLFYSQMISMPAMVRMFIIVGRCESEIKNSAAQLAVRCLATFYGIWNLDFFRSMNFGICLGTDTLQTLALDLIVGVYPLLLMVISYILIVLYDRNFRPLVIIWKPFRRLLSLFREKWDLRTSLIDAFATTFLLTNVKFQSVSFDLLAPVKVYHLNSTGNWTYSFRLFYDATVPYFGSRHLPYAIMALVVVMLFAILPVLLLVLYPFRCFQRVLNLFPVRWYILHTFVDSFYGSYKDGTQPGTRDCRWFASLLILSRFSMVLVGACEKNPMYFPIAAMVLTVVALLFITVQPFKENVRHFTTINSLFVLLLALWHTSMIAGTTYTWGQSITATLPLLYVSALVLHWMYSHQKFGKDMITRLRAWRNGYVADIPGLVPNAHLNKGLGHSFLKHIQRCSILLLVLDASSPNTTMVAQLQHLQRELQLYDNQLLDSAHLIVANKMDTWGELSKQDSNVCGPFEEELHKLQSDTGLPIIPVSALLQWNILPLKEAIFRACN